DLPGNACGKISFPHAHAAVKKEVLEFCPKSIDKPMADPQGVLHHGAGAPPGCFIIKGRRIKIKTEILKSRFRGEFPYIGLVVQKTDDSLFEAVAFLVSD